MTDTKITTVRFTEDELTLLDEIAAHRSRGGVKHSRSDVFRTLLRRAQPPENADRWADAYKRVFGDHQIQTTDQGDPS